VLASRTLYARPRAEIQALLTPIVRLPGFHVRNRRALLRALEIYGTTNRGFGDAMIVATMEQRGANELYSYDRGFDAFPSVKRVEP
jgi:predicted nucleic acid-binding protein